MAIYRNISMTFWTDSKIVDDFSPEDKYFYLYLLTNPHTNLCGCYEISLKQIADEMGYSTQKIRALIDRLEKQHDVIRYNTKTKEILILKWSRYNWTKSEKIRVPITKEIENIKDVDFKAFLTDVLDGKDTVSIPYQYSIDTTVTVSVTDTVSDNKESVDKKDIFADVPPEIKDIFLEWADMRAKKKKPLLTDRAVKRALNKLNSLTTNVEKQRELIDYAIYKNWESFYPIPPEEKLPKPKKAVKEEKIDAVEMPENMRETMERLGGMFSIPKGESQ